MSEPEQPIPIPESFPFEWPDPGLEAHFWTWDQVHQPHPVTPLTATYESPAMSEGSSRGFQALAMPMNFASTQINGYIYSSMQLLEPATSFPPPWWPNVEAEFMRRLPVLTQTWENEYLPEVQAENQRLRSQDFGSLSLDALLAFIDETHERRKRMWDVHMQVVMPVMGVASRFAETYEQLLGKPGGEPYLLLQGFENKSLESGKALWDLSRRALARPAVAKTIADTPREDVRAVLQGTPEGREFWEELQQFLEVYGWRSDAFELADAAWIEDPSIPLSALRDYLGAPEDADPALKEQACVEEREELLQDVLSRLDGNPGKPIFDLMLPVAQQYLPIQENHNFYIDQMNTVLQRWPLLELGRRLVAANAIAQRDDVFYLRYDELASAANGPKSRDWAALVEERRAERERWSAVVPPRELGTPPPLSMRENPLTKAFFGSKPEASKDPKIINGVGASAGTVTATARVVRTLAEAHKLQPGDILVCEMTMPAWTPLFATVKAVVADSGGVLSHCAIVAREYRIPCVVGTYIGTQVIKDGQRITVDGAQGIVRIES
jgi:pyruvate,water dikinase